MSFGCYKLVLSQLGVYEFLNFWTLFVNIWFRFKASKELDYPIHDNGCRVIVLIKFIFFAFLENNNSITLVRFINNLVDKVDEFIVICIELCPTFELISSFDQCYSIICIHDDCNHKVEHNRSHEKHINAIVNPQYFVVYLGFQIALFIIISPFSIVWHKNIEQEISPVLCNDSSKCS